MTNNRRDLLALLMPLSRSLRKIEEAAAAEHGITMWQYAILAAAVGRPGSSQVEVADTLGYSRNRIIGDIDRLETLGQLRRRTGSDRRTNVLDVTDDGATTMRAVRTRIHEREDELLAPLSATARRSFVAALERLRP